MKGGWMTASIVLTLATYWFRAIRWRILLAPLKTMETLQLFAITIVGFAAIYLLGRAGELARPLWLTRRNGVALSGSFATIVVERFIDAIMIILLFSVALIAVELPEDSSQTLSLLKKAAWAIAAAAAIAMAGLFFLRHNATRIIRLIPIRRLGAIVDSFAQGLSFLQNGKSLALVVLHSVLLWITIALQFWFLLLGMNFAFSAGAATLVMVVAGIGSIAQIPGIGGGFQAGYIFSMTIFFNVPAEKAVATSLLATVMSFVPTIAIALVYMLTHGISLRELKVGGSKPESETP